MAKGKEKTFTTPFTEVDFGDRQLLIIEIINEEIQCHIRNLNRVEILGLLLHQTSEFTAHSSFLGEIKGGKTND